MLVKFFRSSFASQYIALVIMALILWLPAFLNPQTYIFIDPLSPFTRLLDFMLGAYPLLTNIIAFVFLIIQALFFNAILAANGLITRVSSIGAFVYILLMSQVQYQTGLYDYLIAAFFILAAIHTILLLYDSNDPNIYLYNTGFFAALASLFYFPSILIIIWIWLCLVSFRQVFLRGWVITIIGFLTPYFFLITWFYLSDQLADRIEVYRTFFSKISINTAGIQIVEWAAWIVLLILILLSVGGLYGKQIEKNVSIRTKIKLSSWLFIITFLSLFYNIHVVALNGMVLIPAGIFISYYLSYTRKLFAPQLLLVIWIVLSIMNQYLSLL